MFQDLSLRSLILRILLYLTISYSYKVGKQYWLDFPSTYSCYVYTNIEIHVIRLLEMTASDIQFILPTSASCCWSKPFTLQKLQRVNALCCGSGGRRGGGRLRATATTTTTTATTDNLWGQRNWLSRKVAGTFDTSFNK